MGPGEGKGGAWGGQCDGRPWGRPSVDSQVADQAEKLLPQPQPPVAFGFLNVKPDPCIDET